MRIVPDIVDTGTIFCLAADERRAAAAPAQTSVVFSRTCARAVTDIAELRRGSLAARAAVAKTGKWDFEKMGTKVRSRSPDERFTKAKTGLRKTNHRGAVPGHFGTD
jgi:hypothetical protein